MRNKIILILILHFLLNTCKSQSLSSNVIASAGGSERIPSTGKSFDYTIGEVMITTFNIITTTPNIKTLTQGFHQPITLESDIIEELDADLFFYTGITPNGDGQNDSWVIKGIEKYPDANVLIYNRWGDLVWKNKNYNNINIVWEGKNSNGTNLTDATYFYIVEINEKTHKGWVELTR